MSTDMRIPPLPAPDVGRSPVTEIIPASVVPPASLQLIQTSLAVNQALPNLTIHEPTALLLDLNNLFKRVQDNGWRIDFVKLKTIFEQRCDLRYKAIFTALDRQDVDALKFKETMEKYGWKVFTKDLRRYTTKDGALISKGNMDINITIEAMKLSAGLGHVILGTCDGDFVELVDELKVGGYRRVSVLGVTNDDWTGMSETLMNKADNFYDLTVLRSYLELKRPR